MKKIIALIAATAFLAACDKIDGPYSEIPQNTTDTGAVRKVLIEDYTGQKCGNCPRAAEAIEAIEAIYGDKVVSMGVHVGYFAEPNSSASDRFTYDFRTEPGNYWDGVFDNANLGLPNGMVNRKEFDGNVVQSYTNWATAVSQIINIEPDANIKITNTYNDANRQLNTTVKTSILNDLGGNYMLCVYLTEDSIVNWQKDYQLSPNDINNYVHRHVLRTTLNGNIGATIGAGSLTKGESFTNQYSITLNPEYVSGHCAIVAFLYNASTKEVVQVEEKKIK